MFGGALSLPNFIIDRLCATLLPVKYEAKGNRFPLIAITMITVQVILTALGVVAYINEKISDFQQTIIFTSFCVFSAVVFSILPIMTRRIDEQYRREHSSVSLRYQSTENLRVARLLNILMVLYATFYISETGLYYIYYYFVKDYLLNKIFMSTYIMSIAAEIFVSIMVTTCSHPKLRSALPQMQRKTKVSTPCGRNVVSTDGRVLSFSADEEQKIYFDSYSMMWRK
ncbi:hypothetical protein Y032_0060g3190 [Ancylostoma ceylanicum]|uniref:Uncharacterized protein n=1 Tax=Ancylostoma ceylanicum TaxID=53326 RepID=A0A016U3R0_9BILA|nr:hypothetical protein Y032_0060g3190 [Ancylostoma ceylanicum]